MSVYIKGFPLPNNCGACPLRLAWCRERIYMVTRPERCPLVPVPEHGRLIDADAAVVAIQYSIKVVHDGMPKILLDYAKRVFNATPTIIPASGGNKDE